MAAKNEVQIFPHGMFVFCATYACRKRASWFIGRPDGPPSLWHPLCDNCARQLVANLPEELRPQAKQEEPVAEQPPQPEEPQLLNVDTCSCGLTFSGPTSRALLAKHQKVCPEAKKLAQKEAV